MEVTDSAFVLSLRLDPRLRRFINPTSARLSDQEAWYYDYLVRKDDYYFIVEDLRSGDPHGTIALYDVDLDRSQAEMGRWVLRPGSLAAAESALLAYQIAFATLGLARVYCRTIKNNEPVVSFHRSAGLKDVPTSLRATLAETTYDVVEQEVTRQSWPDVSGILERQAANAARLLGR